MDKIPDDTNKTKEELIIELEKIDKKGGFKSFDKLLEGFGLTKGNLL